ncbi:site-specific integrase [Bowmanella sp. Y26]|uniref:tyrosine-type recombinase/integrase n=1 Tax=Bowmanella yangjiangensis TaxID=2811230 RepID=UPI001BDCD21E|nr:site-specific integrase [Bowmanella yangjiangensis]MBT1066147.1 site-specific integrase [Bowmanella yangjiangensis]
MAFYTITEKTARGEAVFAARVREKSKYYPQDTTKRFPSYEQALDFAERMKKQYEANVSEIKQKARLPGVSTRVLFCNQSLPIPDVNSTLRAFIELFLRQQSQVPTPTGRSSQAALRAIIGKSAYDGYAIASMRLIDIQYRELSKFCQERTALGAKPSTIASDLSAIMRAVREVGHACNIKNVSDSVFGIHLKQLRRNGFIGNSTTRTRRLNNGEYEKISTALRHAQQRSGSNVDYEAIFILLIETAQRVGELLTLTWQDINWDTSEALVTPNKLRRSSGDSQDNKRTIPLSELARTTLKRLKEATPNAVGTIFPVKASTVSSRFTQMLNHIGIEGLRTHDLRREAVSRLLEDGLSKETVMVITGHKDSRMVEDVYNQMRASEAIRKQELKRMD